MDKRIKIVCLVATLIAIILVAPYFILFHYGFSNESSAWSNFGDYINGILTPILTTVNIYVFIRLTSKISEIEDNRTNEAIQQERERSIKELEQAKSQFEQQLEHEKNLMYFQFRKQELNNFCENINDALSFYPKEERVKKLENVSSYLDSFISSSLKLFMIDDNGVTERKIQRLRMDINSMSLDFMDNLPLNDVLFNRIMEERDSIVKTLQEKTFYNK